MKVCLIILPFIVIIGCTSSIVTHSSNATYTPIPDSINVVMITELQEPPSGSIEIGNFKHREGSFGSGLWKAMKPKVKQFARSKGANIVRVYKYSMGGMVYAGEVSGKLYRVENIPELYKFNEAAINQRAQEGNCSIVHVIRYEGLASLRSIFPMKVFMNGQFVADLPDNSDVKIEIKETGKYVISPYERAGGVELNIEIGKEYYVAATQFMSSSSSPRSIGITVGPQLFETLDAEDGMLRLFLLKTK